jgi:hypothetical protein
MEEEMGLGKTFPKEKVGPGRGEDGLGRRYVLGENVGGGRDGPRRGCELGRSNELKHP